MAKVRREVADMPSEEEIRSRTRVPKSRKGASQGILRVDRILAKMARTVSRSNTRIAQIRHETARKVEALREEAATTASGIFLFFDSNRKELTDDGARKSVNVGAGVIGERKNPPSVKTVDDDDERVIRALRRRGLMKRFTRRKTVVTLDREMIGREEFRATVEKIPGVVIVQDEIFFVESLDEVGDIVRALDLRMRKSSGGVST